MELVNLTPHPLTVTTLDGHTFDIPVGGPAARVDSTSSPSGYIEVPGAEIRLTTTSRHSRVTGLPDAQPGRYLIVSRVVADACEDRPDLLFPDELIRDDDGNVIGCAALSRFTTSERINPT